jgi:hypothetical protein
MFICPKPRHADATITRDTRDKLVGLLAGAIELPARSRWDFLNTTETRADALCSR